MSNVLTPELRTRVEGALWGQACGDAFGMPNSFLKDPLWRVKMEGGPANSPYHAGYDAGRITDDTEQAQSLSDAFARSSNTLDYKFAAEELEAWLDRVGGAESLAVGPSTKRAMARIKAGVPIEEAGNSGTTNGAPMRVAAVGVWAAIHSYSFEQLMIDVHSSCLPTHNTSVAISGAAAVAAAVWAGINGATWEETLEWACKAADAGEELGTWIYAPSISARIREGIRLVSTVTSERQAAVILSEVVGMGEATAESVPAAFAAAAFANRDAGVAIRIAGNSRGDTDTVAAMAGAISGASRGAGDIPAEWRDLVAKVNNLNVSAWADQLANAR
ncbi:ADP-ribosylglycohydrolase family protein [Arthrobacter sp. Soil762]|uniref:ADP-ribosylglycohydrolase family protein n=1 Tax=Arthrobacter sp. Soil762 TaxID=1736401 RepID=UPI0009E9713F|nr:ADP-ribosylglycohydrolase family protein [Arthrobacter sp. Soil762]